MLTQRAPANEIRKYIIEQNILRFEDVYQHLYDTIDSFADGKQSSVILKIADGIKNDAVGPNKQIMFVACVIEILKSLKQ